ncbi:Gfo/Idh/MocA family oxidoreductase [Chloroflexi bacterium TSY]|nr:Gfo/Idh/MocA family oxidoreductase [Chloroflexi bacterium TSY]
MKTYRAAVIGWSRMGGFIDNEVVGAPKHVPPYSHAAGFTYCTRTDLVACADLRVDVMEEFGNRYNVPKASQYTDYREMIARENLDIVSVATQPEPRAGIVIYAADHGVKAIYAEKAFSSSLAEADSMAEALERNNVFLNLGTNRRWSVFYDKMKEVIDSGELGALKTLIAYNNGTLFNTGSHMFDTLVHLNNDQPVEWVQATLPDGDHIFDGDIMSEDPRGEGIIRFANGVTAYAMLSPRGVEFEAICEDGVISALNDGMEWHYRRRVPIDPQGRTGLVVENFPEISPASSTLRLVEDLVHSLDTGAPTRCGAQIALLNMELIFGFIESHRRGGARVSVPVENRSLRMQRDHTPRQPKFTVSVDPNLAFLAIFSRDCRDFGVIYSDFGYRKQPISYLKIAQI